MVITCCVPNCDNISVNLARVRFFKFPKDKTLKQKWIEAVCPKNYVLTRFSRVCEDHFMKDQIQKNTVALYKGKYITMPLRNPRLSVNAVPSIAFNRQKNSSLEQSKVVTNCYVKISPIKEECLFTDDSSIHVPESKNSADTKSPTKITPNLLSSKENVDIRQLYVKMTRLPYDTTLNVALNSSTEPPALIKLENVKNSPSPKKQIRFPPIRIINQPSSITNLFSSVFIQEPSYADESLLNCEEVPMKYEQMAEEDAECPSLIPNDLNPTEGNNVLCNDIEDPDPGSEPCCICDKRGGVPIRSASWIYSEKEFFPEAKRPLLNVIEGVTGICFKSNKNFLPWICKTCYIMFEMREEQRINMHTRNSEKILQKMNVLKSQIMALVNEKISQEDDEKEDEENINTANGDNNEMEYENVEILEESNDMDDDLERHDEGNAEESERITQEMPEATAPPKSNSELLREKFKNFQEVVENQLKSFLVSFDTLVTEDLKVGPFKEDFELFKKVTEESFQKLWANLQNLEPELLVTKDYGEDSFVNFYEDNYFSDIDDKAPEEIAAEETITENYAKTDMRNQFHIMLKEKRPFMSSSIKDILANFPGIAKQINENLFQCVICSTKKNNTSDENENGDNNADGQQEDNQNVADDDTQRPVMLTSFEAISYHLRHHHNFIFGNVCPLCNVQFSETKFLIMHMKAYPDCSINAQNMAMKLKEVSYLRCEVCFKSFYGNEKLNQHMYTQHSKRICHICGKTVLNYSFKGHMDFHNMKNIMRCSFCNRAFSCKKYLESHIRCKHSEERPYMCDQCGESFYSVRMLNTHQQAKHTDERNFPCPNCDMRFKTKPNLQWHVKSWHSIQKYPCKDCGATFAHQTALKKHKGTHTTPFKCQICGERYDTFYNLKLHQLHHADKRRYECPQCGYGDQAKRNVLNHMKTKGHEANTVLMNKPDVRKTDNSNLKAIEDTDPKDLYVHIDTEIINVDVEEWLNRERPIKRKALFEKTPSERKARRYNNWIKRLATTVKEGPIKCELCEREYGDIKSLKKHVSSCHPTKRFQCDYCKAYFNKKSILLAHMPRHTGKYSHICEVCGASFSFGSALNKHMKSHERSVVCELCDQKFSYISNKRVHMLSHATKKKYECLKCRKGFAKKRQLYIHMDQEGHQSDTIIKNIPRIRSDQEMEEMSAIMNKENAKLYIESVEEKIKNFEDWQNEIPLFQRRKRKEIYDPTGSSIGS